MWGERHSCVYTCAVPISPGLCQIPLLIPLGPEWRAGMCTGYQLPGHLAFRERARQQEWRRCVSFRVGPSGRAEPLAALTARGQSWRGGCCPPAGLQLAPRACLSSFLVINHQCVVMEQQNIWVFLRLNPAYGRSSLCSVVGLCKRVLGITWRTVLVCKDLGQQAPSDQAETDHDNCTVY